MQNKIENSDDQLFAHTSPGGMWQPADQTLHRIHEASHTLIREAYRADLVRLCCAIDNKSAESKAYSSGRCADEQTWTVLSRHCISCCTHMALEFRSRGTADCGCRGKIANRNCKSSMISQCFQTFKKAAPLSSQRCCCMLGSAADSILKLHACFRHLGRLGNGHGWQSWSEVTLKGL